MFANRVSYAITLRNSCNFGDLMNELSDLDTFDRKILALLQTNGRLTNGELAEHVALSPSQCSRRRSALEAAGIIRGYRAELDALKVGIGVTCMIAINLATHNEDNADKLHQLLNRLPNVQEAHALTGEMDYSINVVARDLQELSDFINNTLLRHGAVQNVKTSIVLDTIKQSSSLPIDAGGLG